MSARNSGSRNGSARRAARRWLLAAGLALAPIPSAAAAQTDYFNTDAARPVRVEDAYPTERYAFELQLAPLRLERAAGGGYTWEIAPELAYGVLPHTQIEIGFPVLWTDPGTHHEVQGLGGIELAALYNLNVETQSLPALAVAAEVLLPVGGLAADHVYPALKAIATRSLPFGRVHANAQYTFGPEPEDAEAGGEGSRWMAGIAVDRAFPLRAMLAIADVFVEAPLHGDGELAWTVEAGGRIQLSPQLNVDLGVGRRLTGDEPAWFFTFGTAHAFAVRALMPGR